MDDGLGEASHGVGEDPLWKDDAFTTGINEGSVSVYGAGHFATISLSLLFVLGVAQSDLATLTSGVSNRCNAIIDTAFACINNADILFAFRTTLAGRKCSELSCSKPQYMSTLSCVRIRRHAQPCG